MTTNIALTRLLGKKCKVKLQSGSDFVDTLLAIETEERGTFLIFKNKSIITFPATIITKSIS